VATLFVTTEGIVLIRVAVANPIGGLKSAVSPQNERAERALRQFLRSET
jgi:hypothetical protein